ncbi:MAG: hypothetical protein HY907_05580 [Deltaproteobacteria bacterium]|nr:hypothetical protein [Deltaproteobacteria bacterium]
MKSYTAVAATLAVICSPQAAGASEIAAPAEATVVVTPIPTLVVEGGTPAGSAAVPGTGGTLAVPAVVAPPAAPAGTSTIVAPVPGPTTVIDTPGSSTVTVTCPPTQIVVIPPPPPPVVVTTPPPVIVAPPQSCPACPAPPPPAPPPPPVPTTELHFTSNDDEQYVISIYHEDPVWDYEAQCLTPCVLHVPDGTYEFMAGGHRTFQVYAVGGVQYWVVEDNAQGGIVLGSIMTGIGGIVGFAAAIALDLDEHSYDSYRYDSSDPGYNETAAAMTGAGFGTALLGLTIWILSYGMAEQVRPNDGYFAVGERVSFLPTLFPQQDAAGNDRLALGLSLRF